MLDEILATREEMRPSNSVESMAPLNYTEGILQTIGKPLIGLLLSATA